MTRCVESLCVCGGGLWVCAARCRSRRSCTKRVCVTRCVKKGKKKEKTSVCGRLSVLEHVCCEVQKQAQLYQESVRDQVC